MTRSPSATITPGSYFSTSGMLLMRLKRPSRPGAMCALLPNVCGRPVALSRNVVSLVEQGIEGFKYECLIPLLFRLTHRFDPPSTVVASFCGEAAVDQQTVACHERRLAGRKPDGRVGDLFGLANASDGVQGRHIGPEFRLLA